MAQTEQLRKNLTQPGILAALGAALLFGSGTPLAKLLLARLVAAVTVLRAAGRVLTHVALTVVVAGRAIA